MVYFGHNSWIGVGVEGTYGTFPTITDFLEINSEGVAQEDDVIYSNSVMLIEQDKDNYKQARKTVGGNIAFDLRQEGAEKIFYHALGTFSTTTMIADADGTGYKHTFVMNDSLPTGLGVEIDRGAAVSFDYHGGKINTFTLSGDNTGIVNCSCDMIFEDTGTSSSTTPSFSTSDYWMFHDAGLVYKGTTQPVTAWSVTLDNNLTADRYQWGSRVIKEPQRAGRITVTGEMTVEFDSITNYTKFLDGGVGSMAATYTGATIGTANGTCTHALVITLPHVRLSGGTPNVSDSGMLTQTIPFVAYGDGTTTTERPIYIDWTNTTQYC